MTAMNSASWMDEYQRHRPSSLENRFEAFLQLPLTIRERIYSLAGLERSCPISIEDEGSRWSRMIDAYRQNLPSDESFRGDVDFRSNVVINQNSRCAYKMKTNEETRIWNHSSGSGCIHAKLPMQLLQVSKLIRTEAANILYGRNVILLGPGVLRKLPDIAYKSIKLLEIRLTSCSCITDHSCSGLDLYQEFDCCPECHYHCKRGPGEPISAYTSNGSQILSAWKDACEQIKAKCRNLKRLTVICDCKDINTASQVVQPLADDFPLLEYASIRLGQSPNIGLRNIAEKAVRGLTGAHQEKLFHPFQRLPSELQELILCHTDLLAPDYLSWNEPFERRESYGGTVGTVRAGFRLLADNLLICCQLCTISREVCACPNRHAASGSSCKCWDTPMSMFLVSKDFHQKAVRTFFSRNKFVLWERTRKFFEEVDLSYLSDTINILREMPTDWTANIRWFRFCVFEFFGCDGLESSIGLQSWTTLAEVVKSRWSERIDQITIELDLGYRPRGTIPFYGNRRDDAMQSFRNIAGAFQLDQGNQRYKDFFIRLKHYLDRKDWD